MGGAHYPGLECSGKHAGFVIQGLLVQFSTPLRGAAPVGWRSGKHAGFVIQGLLVQFSTPIF